jgi:hypothetical protein
MPNDDHDQPNVVKFRRGRKPRQEPGRMRTHDLKTDPKDIIASGAALLVLVLAVAMVSAWVPVGRYTIGIAACLAGLAVAAKLIKARRSKASVTDLPHQRR